jgi:MFS family permease
MKGAIDNQNELQPWWREVTTYQWLVLVVAWLGWVFDVMDSALFNFAKIRMMTEILGPARYKVDGAAFEGSLQMIFLIGWSVGGLVFSILADRLGRTRTMIYTILIYCFFTGLTAFCHTYEQIAVVRFLTALGIGGEWAAGAALVAEVFPQRARAAAAGFLQSAAAFGPMLAAFINIQLASFGWRWMFIVGVFPALITVVIRAKVKEPEKWEKAHKETPQQTGSLSELFRTPKWRRNLLIAFAIGVVGIAGAGNTSFWIPNLVKSVSSDLSDKLLAYRTSYVTFTMHIGTLVGVFLFPTLCERLGRRRAFGLFFILSAIVVMGVTFGTHTYQSLLYFAPLMALFTIGVSAGFALYFPELFPTRLRATGLGFCYNTGRIVTAPLPWLTGKVIGAFNGSVAAGMGLFAVIYLIGLIAVNKAPETKGQPLPEN